MITTLFGYFPGQGDFRNFPQPQMIYEALSVTAMQMKINVNKLDIINSHILLQIRWGHISFLKLNVLDLDLCSLFSFTYCWNFSWVFTEALTEIFKLAIHTFLQEKPGEIATLQNPCVVFSSQKVLLSLWRGIPKPCQKVGQWGTNQPWQHRDLHSPPVLPLRCYHSEPGSCTAPGFKNDPVPRFDASKQ